MRGGRDVLVSENNWVTDWFGSGWLIVVVIGMVGRKDRGLFAAVDIGEEGLVYLCGGW